ncbi:MAG: methylmalonyl-CoA epimerase [Anaerolineales bacterium]|nr:methylmalonyl-CoA epimerase [Anaerolineales bacterium]
MSSFKTLRINHIALVVGELDAPLHFWRDGLGLALAQTEAVPEQQAEVAFLPVGESHVELVQPTTSDSGLARFLAKRGPGMHHVCVEVDNIRAALAHLKGLGFRLIDETPRLGHAGRQYAFIHPESAQGVLVELYELPPAGSQ